jgi:hypothetical protein
MNIGNLGVNTSSSSHNIDMDRAPGSNIRTACDSCRARKTKVIVVLSIPRHLHSTLASLQSLIGGPLCSVLGRETSLCLLRQSESGVYLF